MSLNTEKKTLGKVHIIKDRCKQCGICIEFCPTGVLAFSEDFNKKGFHYSIPVHPESCINCKNCELMCPDFAIYVTKIDEEE